MRHRYWLLGILCLRVVGCGGNSAFSGSGNGGSSSIALADTPDAYAKAYCSLLKRCGGFLFDLTNAYEDCATVTAENVRQSGYDALEQAVSDGRVVYHADLMPACISAVTNRDCADLDNRTIDACESAITGTAAKGASCELNDECVGSLICETKDACPGTCVDRYSAGTPCSVDDECADGLVCSTATAHCVAPPAEGEPCGGGVEPQCQAGFICSGEDTTKQMPGACFDINSVALGEEGATCDPTNSALCKTGLSCVLTARDGATLNWQCKKPGASAASCGLGVPEDCPVGEYCPLVEADVLTGTFTSKCTALPASGDTCAKRPLSGLLPQCAPYVRCGADNKCIDLRNLGESCSSDNVCYSSHCVSGACESGHTCD